MGAPPVPGRRQLGSVLRSVVKILTVSDAPDYDQPWQTTGPTQSAGSGAIVETVRGLRVLTNAHCVENHVFVEVRRYGKTRKYVASVEAIGHECDLALLSIEDEGFFAGTTPIDLGGLPGLSDRVSVCGYPIGGDRLSVTEGIVSRIEMVRYVQRQRRLLAVQIDAAINAGNSGGPVLRDGCMVGIAMQALDDAEQIGYMVSVPVIEHFLEDVARGIDDGFPALGVAAQALESRAHRRQLELPEDLEDGVLVARVAYGSSAWDVLRVGDVVLDIDGTPVSADGTVAFRDGEQLTFDYVVSKRYVGDTINVKVWRDGGEVTCVLPLKAPVYLVPEDRYDVKPTYFIFGGVVLVPLTRDYLKTWGDSWWSRAPRELVSFYERGMPEPDRTGVVILQKVLADRLNQGYHELESVVIRKAQDQVVRDLPHLVRVIEECSDRFIRLESENGRRIVLDRQEALDRHQQILQRFGVPKDRSEDLS